MTQISADDRIEATDDHKKLAKSLLYKILFNERYVLITLLTTVLLGISIRSFYVIFGPLTNELVKIVMSQRKSTKVVEKYCWIMVGITFVIVICKYIDSICWTRAGSLLTSRIWRDLFLHLMRSDVTFFDTNSIGVITTLISEDIEEIQSSFGTSKSIQVQCISQYISSFLFTFLYSW